MNPLFGGNTLKLGLFCTNGSGASQTLLSEAPDTSWSTSLRTAPGGRPSLRRLEGLPGEPIRACGGPVHLGGRDRCATENIGVFRHLTRPDAAPDRRRRSRRRPSTTSPVAD
jgi:hypothetical protein